MAARMILRGVQLDFEENCLQTGAVKQFYFHWMTAGATLHNMHHSTSDCL